jgi:excinuclease ABC subunit B
MARSFPSKKTGKPTGLEEARQGQAPVAPRGAPPRSEPRSGDSMSERKGFEEAPQDAFEGAPLTGSVSDWAAQLEREAEESARKESMREIRSKAGKHRLKAEKKAQQSSKAMESGPQGRKADRPSEPSRGPRGGPARSAKRPVSGKNAIGGKRTGGGSLIGGSNDPRERAAAGLMPVAGLDVTLEEAAVMASTSGVTATVDALSKLIESGNPLHKNGEIWVPHRPPRPEKSEGGVPIRMETEFKPSGDQPTAIKDLVEGLGGGLPSSPLEGEDVAKRQEGGKTSRQTPPSALPGISPSGGEIGKSQADTPAESDQLPSVAGQAFAASEGASPRTDGGADAPPE